MNRQRKIDEELWEDSTEKLSSDHVVERFFSQHEHDAEPDGGRRHRAPLRTRRRQQPASDRDD